MATLPQTAPPLATAESGRPSPLAHAAIGARADRLRLPLLALAALVLWLSFRWNLFRLLPGDPATFHQGDDILVLGGIIRAKALGLKALISPLAFAYDSALPDWFNLHREGVSAAGAVRYDETLVAYRSQFGLQGMAFQLASLLLPAAPLLAILTGATTLALVATLCWIASSLRAFGPGAGAGFLAGCLLSPWLGLFSASLYWVAFTWFLPFAVGLHLATRTLRVPGSAEPGPGLVAVGAFAPLLLKCLCGYEYVSTILVSACLPWLMAAFVQGWDPRRILRILTLVGLAACAGFIAAVALHVATDGSYGYLLSRALERTGAAVQRIPQQGGGELLAAGLPTIDVLRFYAFSGEIVSGMASGPALLGILMASLVALARGTTGEKAGVAALALGTLVSLAGALSWYVLARQHSAIHVHLNLVLWSLPAIPLAGALVARWMAQARPFRGDAGWRGVGAVAASAAAFAAGLGLVSIVKMDSHVDDMRLLGAYYQGGAVPGAHQDHGVEIRLTGRSLTFRTSCGFPQGTRPIRVAYETGSEGAVGSQVLPRSRGRHPAALPGEDCLVALDLPAVPMTAILMEQRDRDGGAVLWRKRVEVPSACGTRIALSRRGMVAQDGGSTRIMVDTSGEAGLRLRTLAGRILDFPVSGPRKVREVLLLDGLNPLASVVLDGALDAAEAAALDALPPCRDGA